MKDINDGGPAFAEAYWDDGEVCYRSGMTLRVYLAAHAPQPTQEQINHHVERDRIANPHGDGPPKLPRRSLMEIIADIRYAYADAMIAGQDRKPR